MFFAYTKIVVVLCLNVMEPNSREGVKTLILQITIMEPIMRRGILIVFAVLIFTMGNEAFAAKPSEEKNYPDLSDTKITLPWAEFERLLNNVKAHPNPPEESIVKYIVNYANYDVVTERRQLKIEMEFNISVLEKGWHRIPLVSSYYTVSEFSSTSTDDALVVSDSSYDLFTDVPGKRTVKFILYYSGSFNKFENQYQLTLKDEALTRKISVVIPEPGVNASLEPSAQSTVIRSGNATKLVAIPGQSNNLNLTWERTPEAEITSETEQKHDVKNRIKPEAKILAEISTSVKVLETQLECSSLVKYTILNTAINTFNVELPSDVSVSNVKGPLLSNWKEEKGDGVKRVVVYMNEKISGKATLELKYVKDYDIKVSQIQPPTPRAIGVDREKGWIGIGADQNIELNVLEYSDAARLDVSELPSEIAEGAFVAFKYLKQPFSINLELKRNKKVASLASIVDLAAYTSVVLEDGKLFTMCSFTLRSNTQQYLKLNLDKSAEVWTTFVNDESVTPTRNKEGMLLIPLPRGNSVSDAKVEVLYLQKISPMKFMGKVNMEAPMPDIPVTLLMWEMYAPADFDYYNIRTILERYASMPRIQDDVVSIGNNSEDSHVFGMKKLNGYGDKPSFLYEKSSPRSPYGNEYSKSVQNITRLGDYVSNEVAVQNIQGQQYQSGAAKGIIPIAINLPKEGKYYFFLKVMPKDESHKVSMSYLSGQYLRWGKRIAIGLCLIITVLLSIGVFRKPIEEFRLERAAYCALFFAIILEPGHKGIVTVAIIACALALAGRKILSRRRASIIAFFLVILASCQITQAGEPGSVIMPWTDYDKLVKASQDPVPPELPEASIDYSILSGRYNARYGDGAMVVDASYEINVLSKSPVKIELFSSASQRISEFASSEKGDLLINEGAAYKLLATNPGKRKLRVSYVVKVPFDLLSGDASINTPLSVMNEFELEVPGKLLDVEAKPGSNMRTIWKNGDTYFSANFSGLNNFNISWKRKVEDIKPEERPEPRVSASTLTHVVVSEGLVSYASKVNYSINHAGVRSYLLELPADVDIIGVSGQRVQDISISSKDNAQEVLVLLAEEVIGSDSIVLKYESVYSENKPFKTYAPTILNISSESSFMAVSAQEELELQPVDENDSQIVDPSEVLNEFSSLTSMPILYAYKGFDKQITAEFAVSKNTVVSVVSSVVSSAKYASILLEDGRILNSYNYDLNTHGQQFFDLVIPESCDVWGATVNNTPVISSEADGNHLLIPVQATFAATNKGSSSGTIVSVEIISLCSREKKIKSGKHKLVFPKTDIPISIVEASVYVPKEWAASNLDGTFGEGEVGNVTLLSYVMPSLEETSYVSHSAPAAEPDKIRAAMDDVEVQLSTVRNEEITVKTTGGNFLSNADVSVRHDAPTRQYVKRAKRRGAMPVHISLPTTGLELRFKKHMVIGERPEVEFELYPEPALRYVKYGFIIAVIMCVVFVFCLTGMTKIFTHMLTGPVIAMALPLAILSVYMNVWVDWLVPFVFIICVTLFFIRVIKTKWNKWRA